MKETTLKIVDRMPKVTKGTAGLCCQASAMPATVSSLAIATGGIGKGQIVETYK